MHCLLSCARCIADNIILIAKAFRNQFIIPEFTRFTNRIDELFWRAKANTKGKRHRYRRLDFYIRFYAPWALSGGRSPWHTEGNPGCPYKNRRTDGLTGPVCQASAVRNNGRIKSGKTLCRSGNARYL
ncbi:glutaminase kidney isoform, mitochondrial [Elysia marginata]|uniref:Glutaminase kidney isoform, mitochondrial n=1 Tax=Elysia marginata TaxID=1093978 RepID=A0AAV4G9Z4_9GAST|nr:glutaminase kidney isoform, mitochondrial [Elysia marginata]